MRVVSVNPAWFARQVEDAELMTQIAVRTKDWGAQKGMTLEVFAEVSTTQSKLTSAHLRPTLPRKSRSTHTAMARIRIPKNN